MKKIKSAFLLLFLVFAAGCQINDEKMKGFISAEVTGDEQISVMDNNAGYQKTGLSWGDLRVVSGEETADTIEYALSVEINDYGKGQMEFDLSEYQNGNIILFKRNAKTGKLIEDYTFPQDGMISLSILEDSQIAGSFYGTIVNNDASATITVSSGTFALKKEVVGTVQ